MTSALNQLIRDAFADSATDVFLLEDEPPRIRREGDVVVLHPGQIPRVAMEEFWKSCGIDPAGQLEADVSWRLPGGSRLRVNLYHSLGRLAAVLRPIRDEIPPLSELGLPGPLLESWMQRRYGLILVTGPTGSGKSTTVASCLDWINHHLSRHIVTLEDPIEFLFTNDKSLFSQREIRHDSADFSTGLRSALRQSPGISSFRPSTAAVSLKRSTAFRTCSVRKARVPSTCWPPSWSVSFRSNSFRVSAAGFFPRWNTCRTRRPPAAGFWKTASPTFRITS